MFTLTLFGIALTMVCIAASSPVYQFLAIGVIIVIYFMLLDKEY